MSAAFDLKAAFKALSAVPLDTLQEIAGEAIQEFLPLQEQLKSDNPQEREKARLKAEALHSKMAKLLTKVYADAGIDLASVVNSLKNQNQK